MLPRLFFFAVFLMYSSAVQGQDEYDYETYLKVTRSSGLASQMEAIRSSRIEIGARRYVFSKSGDAFRPGIQISLGAWNENGPAELSCRDCSALLLRGIELGSAVLLRLERMPLPVLFNLGFAWATADAQYLSLPGTTPPGDAIAGDQFFSYTAGVALELPLTQRIALLGSLEMQRPINRTYYVARFSPWLGVRMAI